MNVWVEDGELLFYISRSGCFDENNTFLKSGRVRLTFDTPLDTQCFTQRLNLEKGRVEVEAGRGRDKVQLTLWADVYRPTVHLEMNSARPRTALVAYENWRYQDRLIRKNEGFQNSYKWAPPKGLTMKKEMVWLLDENEPIEDILLCFIHFNPDSTIFDRCVWQQGMQDVKGLMYNPLGNGMSGGVLRGENFAFKDSVDGTYLQTDYRAWRFESVRPARSQEIMLSVLAPEDGKNWHLNVFNEPSDAKKTTEEFWKQFWERSYICINTGRDTTDAAWKAGRNYQLFRYQLACNAYGSWPTKFNGGLFTFDPVFVNDKRPFTPDFRNWGGGTFTAQNQRLVYFPMLKSGDTDMMTPQFDFYNRILKNAELRSQVYWGHEGACFTEQIENFGLPNPSEYGWKRPEGFDPGMEYNKWLEYQWDTALEFCFMILEANRYSGMEIEQYIPLIESTLTFFDRHYRYLAIERGEEELDGEGHLKLYPGSACETYKLADNAVSTIAALKTVTESLIAYLPQESRQPWIDFLSLIPPMSFRKMPDLSSADSLLTISPASSWARINNTEAPQLYPVWPWGMYNLLSEDLEVARNTYLCDSDVVRNKTHVGWKQYNIFSACLGMTDEAKELTLKKMADSDHRFPTFWGPGYDWTPDHNWGGSGMIGMQEMLLQSVGDTLLLFPAWPSDWDVSFRLHAPHNTVVEATLKDGKLKELTVTPSSRANDVKLCLPD